MRVGFGTQRIRKSVEDTLRWAKTVAGLRKMRHRPGRRHAEHSRARAQAHGAASDHHRSGDFVAGRVNAGGGIDHGIDKCSLDKDFMVV